MLVHHQFVNAYNFYKFLLQENASYTKTDLHINHQLGSKTIVDIKCQTQIEADGDDRALLTILHDHHSSLDLYEFNHSLPQGYTPNI